jgi:hypothetical protein
MVELVVEGISLSKETFHLYHLVVHDIEGLLEDEDHVLEVLDIDLLFLVLGDELLLGTRASVDV